MQIFSNLKNLDLENKEVLDIIKYIFKNHFQIPKSSENISHTKVPPGQDQVTFMIPKVSVGVVIGKSGETINRIQEQTQTRIQFVPDDPKITDRGCYIIGPKEGTKYITVGSA